MHGGLYILLGIGLVISWSSGVSVGNDQSYIVTGRFMCGTIPSNGDETSVKLLDKNIGPDTVMGKMKVDSKGAFRIDGKSSGITKIDPELHIYTDCNDGKQALPLESYSYDKYIHYFKPCQRRWKLKLPKKYIDNPDGYDIGTMNLESELVDGEDRDCWH